ncbi:hypothetical protein GN244_ATG16808 [Phytophthora infestans]|uniref:Uncharacterized protein n=1 Tax=Phytophthora infestans TaxID=4787 RepID=A0A833W627_PHYIN|nr:hypothetical protein GN244_ATG16808 [Phytophthora infestans]KAF4141800.1 hypothetical protein GN958_ATG09045 [Phytophthora infestans]
MDVSCTRVGVTAAGERMTTSLQPNQHTTGFTFDVGIYLLKSLPMAVPVIAAISHWTAVKLAVMTSGPEMRERRSLAHRAKHHRRRHWPDGAHRLNFHFHERFEAKLHVGLEILPALYATAEQTST